MKRRGWRSIRGKLVVSTLPLVLLPIVAVGAFAVASLRSVSDSSSVTVNETRAALAEEVVGPRVRAAADQISREIGYFVSERLLDAETWATSPALIQAASGAATAFEESGLTALTTDQLEARYTAGTLTVQPLPADPTASFQELFFTDRRGYTVASNTKTSDFVQSDEEWWQNAWERGLDISAVDFDESANAMSVDISVRIDDERGRPVGVMKAVLAVANIQAITDRFSGGSNGYEITVTDQRGMLLAETASGHDPARIVNEETSARNSDNPRLARALAMAGNIYVIDDEAVTGFSQINRVIAEGADLSSDQAARSLKVAFDWRVVVEQPVDVAFGPLEQLELISTDISDTSSRLSWVLAGVALAAGVIALMIVWLVSQRITAPIHQLSISAHRVATETLPDVVTAIEVAGEGEPLPEVPDIEIATRDEVQSLAEAFNAMQHTATRLAGEQAQLRRSNVARTFVSLGRRNQSLLTRQLELLDGMEREEADPDALRQLFRLDHLATRMRRNAESLLVLAGEDVPRRFRRPVAVHDVIQAAGAEIEDFTRIEVMRVDNALIDGTAASAVAHLLAELLENASRYSPPTTKIQIDGRLREDGFAISLVDQGIGMSDEDLADANARLADPGEFGRAPSAYLGLFVVGHLARRHGITVRMAHSPLEGIVVRIDLPTTLLVNPDRRPTLPPDEVNLTDTPTTAPSGTVSAVDLAPPVPEIDTSAPEVTPVEDQPVPAVFDAAPTSANPFESIVPPSLQGPQPVPIAPSADAVHVPVPETPSAPAETAPPFTDQPVPGPVPMPPVPAALAGHGVPGDETTPSGFRRRRRGEEGAPTTSSPAAAAEPRVRDAKAVGSFLSNFRSGVNKGRVEVWDEGDDRQADQVGVSNSSEERP